MTAAVWTWQDPVALGLVALIAGWAVVCRWRRHRRRGGSGGCGSGCGSCPVSGLGSTAPR